MKLIAGERFRLHDDNTYLKLVSGKLEAYAVTRKKQSFRQIFLTEVAPGQAAFPSMDEFEQIDVLVYAVEDSELTETSLSEISPEELLPLMRQWFAALVSLPWLRLLADKGDEVLRKWADGSVLTGHGQDRESLLADFADNEGIFAMLLGVRFNAQDKRLSRKHAWWTIRFPNCLVKQLLRKKKRAPAILSLKMPYLLCVARPRR